MCECLWPKDNVLLRDYHEKEWCVPTYEDTYLFQMLTLEGAQAGLSWLTVLSKRRAYQEAFHYFDISYCMQLTDEDIEKIRENYQVIKNRAKLKSVRSNAIAIREIQKEFGSLSDYMWQYTHHKPIINSWENQEEMPAETPLSQQISKDLKKRGFKFVGPIIIYSYMQAIGMVDDHIISCPYHTFNRKK